MKNLLQSVRDVLWQPLSDWIEASYSNHPGLFALLSVLVAAVALRPLFKKGPKPKGDDKTSLPSPPPLDDITRRDLLNRIQREVVDPGIFEGLREAIRVDLNLSETPQPMTVRLRLTGSMDSGIEVDRPLHGPIQKIFEQIGIGRLMIIGEPGTGKTNLLLELAQRLITEAKRSSQLPIPIVFTLARWTLSDKTRTLSQWLTDDLHHLYGLSPATARELVRQDAILPLLDGLDEVAEERRAACVDAIHGYQSGRNLGRLVISSRTEEYCKLQKKPDIPTVVRVEKLSPTDLDRELAKPGLEHVRRALEANPGLRSLIETPLWLNVLFLAVRGGKSYGTRLDTPARLYDQYVDYALNRSLDESPRNRSDSNRLLHWLGWLAVQLRLRNQTQLAVEELNLSWLSLKRVNKPVETHKRDERPIARDDAALADMLPRYRTRVGLVQRIIFGVAFGLVGGLLAGWVFGAVVGIIAGVRIEGRIEAADALVFEWCEARSRLPLGIFYGTIFVLVFTLTTDLGSGLSIGLLAGIFELLQGGFRPRSISLSSEPNGRTLRSLRYALWTLLLGLLLAAGLAIMGKTAAPKLPNVLPQVAVLVGFGSIILAGEKGGWFALRHYTTRLLLWKRDLAPMRYVTFLDEAVERLFLIRRGSSYEFLHVTFRDYMAGVHSSHNDGSELAQRARKGAAA